MTYGLNDEDNINNKQNNINGFLIDEKSQINLEKNKDSFNEFDKLYDSYRKQIIDDKIQNSDGLSTARDVDLETYERSNKKLSIDNL